MVDIKKLRWIVFVFLSGVILYLLFGNLSGAMQAWSDENRVYHLTPFSPLLYVICRPFTHLFKSQDAAYYVFAFMGLINILLVGWLAKKFFESNKPAIYAMLFYAFSGYALSFTKILFYSTPFVTFLLVAIAFFVISETKGKAIWMIGAGMMLGFMFLTNVSAYTLIFACGVFWLYVKKFNVFEGVSKVGWFSSATFLVLGIAIGYGIAEGHLLYLVHKYPHMEYKPIWKELGAYRTLNANDGTGWPHLLTFLKVSIDQFFLSSPFNFIRNWCVVLFIALGLFFSFKHKDKKIGAVLVLLFAGIGIITSNVLLGVHGVYIRNLVWIVAPISWVFGGLLHRYLTSSQKSKSFKTAMTFIILVYSFLAVGYSWQVSHSLFRVQPILDYFEKHDINKTEVMTRLQINRYEDFRTRQLTKGVPFFQVKDPKFTQDNIHLRIYWPAVIEMYRKGQVKYYLTSSIGHVARAHLYDPVLAKVEPIMSWDYHPLNNKYMVNPHLMAKPENYNIELYDIRHILKSLERKRQAN